MKYIGENAIKKLISLIKDDLATKQDSIAATGVLERDTTGVINGVETVGATLVETQEAKLVDVPDGLLKGDGTTISAAVAGTDYVNSSQAIRYDAAQTLTDAQKTQARGNIAAAPDGFGLGGSATLLTPADNLDTLMKNGWFYYNTPNAPQGTLPSALATYATFILVSVAGNSCVQEAFDSTDSNLHGIVLRRTIYGLGPGAQIYPWEWVNPPMHLGVEYRTTERYLGKPVYKKLLSFTGAMTDGYSDMTHNIANISNVVGCYAELFAGSSSLSTPILDGNNMIIFSAGVNSIRKTSVGNYSAFSARVLMSYTKTTD